MHDFYGQTGPDKFDIAAPAIGQVFPPTWAAEYLNDAATQRALGVPLNWTGTAVPIALGFDQTGDFLLGDGPGKLGRLLDRGVNVALLYGTAAKLLAWQSDPGYLPISRRRGTQA